MTMFLSPHPLLTPLPSFPSLIPLIPQYASVEQVFEDLNLLFDSTCLAYPKESPLYKVSCAAGLIPPLQASSPLPSSLMHTHTQDAIVLHRAAVKKYLQLTGKKSGVELYMFGASVSNCSPTWCNYHRLVTCKHLSVLILLSPLPSSPPLFLSSC